MFAKPRKKFKEKKVLTDAPIKQMDQDLSKAENDTKLIAKELKDIELHLMSPEKLLECEVSRDYDMISPFKIRNADPEVLKKNYESLVNKIVALESQLHTMKLHMCSYQTEWDLHQRWESEFSSDLEETKKYYEAEIVQLKRKLQVIAKEKQELGCESSKSKVNLTKLEKETAELKGSELELTQEVAAVKSERNKLQRHLEETSANLGREVELRKCLEASQTTLFDRIKDLEISQETDAEERSRLNLRCRDLEHEVVSTQEAFGKEEQRRLSSEEKLVKHLDSCAEVHEQVSGMEEERQLLILEIGKLRDSFSNLNQQLDIVQSSSNTQQYQLKSVQQENEELKDALVSAHQESTNLVNQYEKKLTCQREDFDETDRIIDLREKLRQEGKVKDLFEQKTHSLDEEVKQLHQELLSQQTTATQHYREKDRQIKHLETQFHIVDLDRQKLVDERDKLMDEVNQCVTGMTSEKSRLDTELVNVRLELEAMRQDRGVLESSRNELIGRLESLEQERVHHASLSATLTELAESKRTLAYEKGRLQTEVDSLRSSSEQLAAVQGQLEHGKRAWTALETRFTKTQADLSQCRLHIQSLEGQVRQRDELSQRRQRELQLAVQSRDEAMKEAQRLVGHAEAVEERERKKVYSLQATIEECQADNRKIRQSLESVMESHSQLQRGLEVMQTEIGQKDALVTRLRQEKSEDMAGIGRLQSELDAAYIKVGQLEKLETDELEPLRRSFQTLKDEKKKISESLEKTLKQNQDIRQNLKDLEKTHGLLETSVGEALRDRDKAEDEKRAEGKSYQERIKVLREQLSQEREMGLRRTGKEGTEIRRTLEKSSRENCDLIDSNSSLRHHVADLEFQLKEASEKRTNQSENSSNLVAKVFQNEPQLHLRQQEDLEETRSRMRHYRDEVTKLEDEKVMFLRKTRQQDKTIEKFVEQIESLQKEVQNIRSHQVPCRPPPSKPSSKGNISNRIVTQTPRTEGTDSGRSTNQPFTPQIECSDTESQIPFGEHPSSYRSNVTLDSIKERVQEGELEGRFKLPLPSAITFTSESSQSLANKAQQAILSTRQTMDRLSDYIVAHDLQSPTNVTTISKLYSSSKERVPSNTTTVSVDDNSSSSITGCSEVKGQLSISDPMTEAYKAERDFNKYLDEQLNELKKKEVVDLENVRVDLLFEEAKCGIIT